MQILKSIYRIDLANGTNIFAHQDSSSDLLAQAAQGIETYVSLPRAGISELGSHTGRLFGILIFTHHVRVYACMMLHMLATQRASTRYSKKKEKQYSNHGSRLLQCGTHGYRKLLLPLAGWICKSHHKATLEWRGHWKLWLSGARQSFFVDLSHALGTLSDYHCKINDHHTSMVDRPVKRNVHTYTIIKYFKQTCKRHTTPTKQQK